MESFVNLVGGAHGPRDAHDCRASGRRGRTPRGTRRPSTSSAGSRAASSCVAALSIAAAAVTRFLDPRAIEQVGLGLAVSVTASVRQPGVALVLLRAGQAARVGHPRGERAPPAHRRLDVRRGARGRRTGGVDRVAAPRSARRAPRGREHRLDRRRHRPFVGPGADRYRAAAPRCAKPWSAVLAVYRSTGVEYHALRTRQAGARRFVSFHVLVPGAWTVQQGHELVERIEAELRRRAGERLRLQPPRSRPRTRRRGTTRR